VPAPHTPPRDPHPISPHSAATATQPANQNSMVRASTPMMANLWAAAGKREGARTRYVTARRVQSEQKSRKFTLSGDHEYQGPVEASTTMEMGQFGRQVGGVLHLARLGLL